MKRVMLNRISYFIFLFISMFSIKTVAQNIFSGERVQVVGSFNGYGTNPYGTDYRTTIYRKVATTTSNLTDGRGQWVTTMNAQSSGGDFTPTNMTGGGGNGFLFISGPSSNRFQNKWVFSGVGQGTVGAINNISAFNSGNDMGLNMSTAGRYTFVFNDAGYTTTNAKYYVGYTLNAPVTVTRTGLSYSLGQPIVAISSSETPSSGENIYVRYRVGTNDFSTGTSVVQATGSGTSWTATLPSQACGNTIYYYVYSSTRTLSQITADSESDRSLATLNYDDNAGANYAIVFSPSTAALLSGSASICAGATTNLQVTITGGTSPYEITYSDGTSNFTVTNYTSGSNIPVTPSTTKTYNLVAVKSANLCLGSGNSGSALVTVNPNVTYYNDNDGDGFGDASSTQILCTGTPSGYVTNSLDCNDNQIQYLDNDGDTFGSITQVACGVANNSDCNDNQLQYLDDDGDTFGSTIQVACGVANNLDCDDTIFSTTNSCNSIVNLKLFIEGYYLGAGAMQPVLLNQGVGSSSTDVESITVELRDATTYSVVASTTAILQSDGTVSCVYPTAPNGFFYIAITSKNAVQTWSANPITVGATPTTYDFSISDAQAYGNNLKEMIIGEGVYGLLSGDINQDEVIDGSDSTNLINDIENANYGSLSTDLNGDGVVDGSDSSFLINNTENAVFSSHP